MEFVQKKATNAWNSSETAIYCICTNTPKGSHCWAQYMVPNMVYIYGMNITNRPLSKDLGLLQPIVTDERISLNECIVR
jgi:hypothetical protein